MIVKKAVVKGKLMYRIFIDGKEGTTGLKIHDYLSKRNDVSIINIHDDDRKKLEVRLKKINEADITFLCLPDEASREIAKLVPLDKRIIDTSTAHRVDDNWIYGLSELSKEQKIKIKNSNRVANPGCHATGFILLVRPLIENGIFDDDTFFSATSLTGYSGGGKKMIASYEDDNRSFELSSPGLYGLSQTHKHLPEMIKATGVKNSPTFLPIVCDYFRGMSVSIPLPPKDISIIKDVYRKYYGESELVSLQEDLPQNGMLYSNHLSGKNNVEIYVSGSNEKPVVTALYDNLGKGASGAAIQNMNIMLGIEETKGLL